MKYRSRAWARAGSAAFFMLAMALASQIPASPSHQNTAKQVTLTPQQLLENLKTKSFSGKPMDILLSDATLQEVLSEIEKAGGIRLDLDPAIDDKVTYQIRQRPWDEALATVLADNTLNIDIDMAGIGFKIYRGEKSIVVFNEPAKLKIFLFLYNHLVQILAVGILLACVGIGLRLYRKRKARRRTTRKKPLMPAGEAEAVKEKLLSLLEVEKVYRQDDLSLQSLAGKLSVTPHQLSWIINEILEVSFSSLVNGYRIEEVKRRLSDPSFNHSSILQAALEAGFNTKAAFNRAFKKHTGMTPSQFKETNAL